MTGVVTDINNVPLVGVNVFNDSGKGVITDINGSFTLALDQGGTKINFSYIGFETLSQQYYLDANELKNVKIVLNEVSKKLKISLIVNKTKSIENWFRKTFKRKPKIAILGLNPHNAEYRKNSEEKKIIIPAILKIKKLKINARGPLVADTIFIKDYKNFDVIIGMYHDQVLAPFKSLFKFDAINITLGLSYLRVSPDHGVAVDLIGKNKANPDSLFECINFVSKYKG